MTELKAKRNIQKLQENIEKGLHDIVAVEGNAEARAAGFFLMGNALNASGNLDYAKKYYEKASELYQEEGISNHITTAKLINLCASQGEISLVKQHLYSLIENYPDIENKPAVAKEIKQAFKDNYKKEKFKIQLNQVLEECKTWLEDNPNIQASQQEVKMLNKVVLDDKVKQALDDILVRNPSELAQIFSNPQSIGSHLRDMFSEMNLKISSVESKVNARFKKLTQDINQKPSNKDLEVLAQKTKQQISEVYSHNQEEADKLKKMISRVEANSATQEDVNWINNQLETNDGKTLESARELIVLKNMFYNIESANSSLRLEMSDLKQNVNKKTKILEENVNGKIEEIYDILKTKANLGDLEYVNEEIQEISGSRYDDAQKIKMLDQLLVGVKQRVDVQDATIVNFKLHVEQKFNEYKDDISNLFNKFSQLQASNLTTEQLLQLISETETHAKLITGLNNDIKGINDTIDPSVVEFMHNYQDQRATLDTIIQIIQEYKNINPVTNNEQLASILREEIERAKKELGNEIQDINTVLRETKIYKKAQLSKDFANLEGSDAGVYAKAFASSLYTYIESYQLAKEGLFQVTQEKLTPDFVASSLKAIPVIGNALDSINTYANNIYGTKDSMTKEQRINKIDAIIKNNFILDDIKLYVSEVALKMIENSTVKRLLSSDQQHNSHGFLQKTIDGYTKIKEALDTQLNLLKQVITGVDAVNDEDFIKISKLALEHVGLFMEALCRKDGENLPESLEEFISTQIFETLEKEEQVRKDIIDSKASKNKCIICNVNDIVYDNELLNHPELFNKLANIYGANKVLDLSTSICPLLISQSIEHDDINLLLGGFMSLDASDGV